jgi:two-component system NtrC family sensor kinase
MKISLKTKLVISFTAVIIICGLVITLVGSHVISNVTITQAEDRVRSDLITARTIYNEKGDYIKDVIRFTSERFFLKDAILENDIQKLSMVLAETRRRESLDILNLTDKNGQVIVRTSNPSVHGDNQEHDELVRWVLSKEEVVFGTTIVSGEQLLKEGKDLAEKAHIKYIPTPTEPVAGTEETSGMMIKAAAPVLYNGNLIGVLYGGNLINHDYEIVNEVQNIVYKGIKYKGKDTGTSMIFQWDLLISANVKKEDRNRAIGTRVSQEVYEQVLLKGTQWIDRAFVINNWYITAHEPIKNVYGEIIGILYVGILEEKLTDMRKRSIALFLGITIAGMIVALIISFFLAKGILEPVKRLVDASHRWAKGELEYRVKHMPKDEMGDLGETFNLMASSLKDRDERLKEYTEQRIMKSERLAILGQLAAGVAHEINNPLGAVIMYIHLGLEDLETKDLLRKNMENAVREASRCKNIVKGLLDFAHQTNPSLEELDVNDILERTLSMVENQASFQNIKITRVISSSLPKIMIDASQMQQVFTNLIINAAGAMEGRGKLSIATRENPEDESIEIEFSDTGYGISKENLERLFDPFFTTKEVGRGTGLGLAISYGIITKHNGNIEVKSELGKGSTFIIRLPIKKKEG